MRNLNHAGQFANCHGRYSGPSLSISLLITVMTKGLNGGSLVERGPPPALHSDTRGWEFIPAEGCNTHTTLAPDSSDASRLVTFERWAWGFLEGQMDWVEMTIGSRSSVTEGGPGGTSPSGRVERRKSILVYRIRSREYEIDRLQLNLGSAF